MKLLIILVLLSPLSCQTKSSKKIKVISARSLPNNPGSCLSFDSILLDNCKEKK